MRRSLLVLGFLVEMELSKQAEFSSEHKKIKLMLRFTRRYNRQQQSTDNICCYTLTSEH